MLEALQIGIQVIERVRLDSLGVAAQGFPVRYFRHRRVAPQAQIENRRVVARNVCDR